MQVIQKWIPHTNILFTYFYSIQHFVCSHRKEAYFSRKGMGAIVCLVNYTFSKMWFKKIDYRILKKITNRDSRVIAKAVPPDKELYRFVLGKLTWALTGRSYFFVMASKVKSNTKNNIIACVIEEQWNENDLFTPLLNRPIDRLHMADFLSVYANTDVW